MGRASVHPMTGFDWLVIAPAWMFGLSGIGWAWLWFTRSRDGSQHPAPVAKPQR